MLIMIHASNELQNLDYDKVTIQVVFFLLVTFYCDILFKMPPVFPNILSSSHMQGMDKKYDGHVWSKVITTNIYI